MHACELGVRCPLFLMALHRSELHHSLRASAKRLRGKGPGDEGWQRFNVWLLRDVRSKAVQELPLLQNLPRGLSAYAYMYCRATLDLPLPADKRGQQSVDELNKVLLEYLCQDRRGRHLRTFCALELECERCLGVQRVRSYHFSWDKLFKRNWAQYRNYSSP